MHLCAIRKDTIDSRSSGDLVHEKVICTESLQLKFVCDLQYFIGQSSGNPFTKDRNK